MWFKPNFIINKAWIKSTPYSKLKLTVRYPRLKIYQDLNQYYIIRKKYFDRNNIFVHSIWVCRDILFTFSSKRHEKNKASTQDLLLALTGCKFERKTIYGEIEINYFITDSFSKKIRKDLVWENSKNSKSSITQIGKTRSTTISNHSDSLERGPRNSTTSELYSRWSRRRWPWLKLGSTFTSLSNK